MRPPFAGIALFLVTFGTQSALAQDNELSLDELQARNGKKLSKEELEQFLPGARVTRTSDKGTQYYWTNNPDGRFIGNKRSTSHSAQRGGGAGTWRISEDGQYCVEIEWGKLDTEKWCRDIYLMGANHYMVKQGKSDKGGKAILLEIKK